MKIFCSEFSCEFGKNTEQNKKNISDNMAKYVLVAISWLNKWYDWAIIIR